MAIKKNTLNRLKDAEIRANQIHPTYIQQIIKRMTTEELHELADENTIEERCNEIWERAENEYKSEVIKKT
jgi:hypothetical protein